MDRRLKIFGLLLLAISINGATNAASQDSAVLPATGSPMTPEWKQYNDQAEIKGQPLLKYVVTAKTMTQTKEREPAQIQDSFSLGSSSHRTKSKSSRTRNSSLSEERYYYQTIGT